MLKISFKFEIADRQNITKEEEHVNTSKFYIEMGAYQVKIN